MHREGSEFDPQRDYFFLVHLMLKFLGKKYPDANAAFRNVYIAVFEAYDILSSYVGQQGAPYGTFTYIHGNFLQEKPTVIQTPFITYLSS